MKIGVLFNCQFDGLTRSLQFFLPRHDVVGFELGALIRDEAALLTAKEVLDGCDVTVSVPAGPRFDRLSNESLRASCRHLVLLPPVTFSGLHPDTVYVTGPDKVHRLGPTGAYHSRLVVLAFLGQFDIDAAADLFNSLVFARVGYLTAFERERRLLCEQFARFGVDVSAYFRGWEASGCFMHSMNHPKIHVLQDLARMACSLLDFEPSREPVPPMTDILEAYPRHPILDPLARRLGLPAEQVFVPRRRAGQVSRTLELRDFIAESFAVYKSTERSILSNVDHLTWAGVRLGIPIDADAPPRAKTGPGPAPRPGSAQ